MYIILSVIQIQQVSLQKAIYFYPFFASITQDAQRSYREKDSITRTSEFKRNVNLKSTRSLQAKILSTQSSRLLPVSLQKRWQNVNQ